MNVRVGDAISLVTKYGEVRVRHFRAGKKEGVVLISLLDLPNPIPVRVQSSCLFGESFWATDCDCSMQLRLALETITSQGGLVLYIYEEGRGAGLESKIEAIRLQQESGYDTRKAYECLMLDPDARSYTAASKVLQRLLPQDAHITLLTNNPNKVKRLRESGLNIVGKQSLVYAGSNEAVKNYLLEKERVLGHEISEFLKE